MTLFDQATTFLVAQGWEVEPGAKGDWSIVGWREELGEREYLTVWCPSAQDMRRLHQWEPAAIRRFSEDANNPGRKVLLLDSLAGLTRDFTTQTKASNVTIQVPIQFFDRTFSWDDNAPEPRRRASVARQMREAGQESAKNRIQQPYEDADGNRGDDLLAELMRKFELSAEWNRPIVLVTAPAGYGKTMLFQSLFAAQHEYFHKVKQRRDIARRPVPLLPEHLGRASSTSLQSLVEEFLKTDVAGSMGRPTFEWMLINGYASWMLDGLDEVIARDPNFFVYLEDILLSAEKEISPRILLCVRDSLLSTSDGLRMLVNEVDGWVNHYRLLPWKRDSIETFARMRLGNESWRMVDWVDHKPHMLKLCGTPYYAELVAERVKTDRAGLLIDIPERELVHSAFRAMLQREYDKGLIRADQFSLDDLHYVVRDAAKMQLENTGRGINVEQFQEEVAVLAGNLDPADQEAVAGQLVKLSVFTKAEGRERGHVLFADDVIQEYLVGEYALDYFGSQPIRFLDLLDWKLFAADSIVLRMLTDDIDIKGAGDELIPLLIRARGSEKPTAFRNILSMIVKVRDAASLLAMAPLDRQDLSGLTLANIALEGVSMRGANLESATFDGCDLTGLDLADAVLNHTRFLRCSKTIHAASYGTLSGLTSVNVDGRHFDTAAAFMQHLRRSGKKAGASVDPCAHANQLRAIFGAFLYRNGRLRRAKVKRTVLAKGPVLDAAVRAGFITHQLGRDAYECAKGEQFKAMVGFSRNLETTSQIVTMLDSLCPVKGCSHTGL